VILATPCTTEPQEADGSSEAEEALGPVSGRASIISYGLPHVAFSEGPSGGSLPHAPQWPLYWTASAQATHPGVGLSTSPTFWGGATR
jgi:hypothetical protein